MQSLYFFWYVEVRRSFGCSAYFWFFVRFIVENTLSTLVDELGKHRGDRIKVGSFGNIGEPSPFSYYARHSKILLDFHCLCLPLCFSVSSTPVSYTHLDVYKRQLSKVVTYNHDVPVSIVSNWEWSSNVYGNSLERLSNVILPHFSPASGLWALACSTYFTCPNPFLYVCLLYTSRCV